MEKEKKKTKGGSKPRRYGSQKRTQSSQRGGGKPKKDKKEKKALSDTEESEEDQETQIKASFIMLKKSDDRSYLSEKLILLSKINQLQEKLKTRREEFGNIQSALEKGEMQRLIGTNLLLKAEK